MRVGSLTIRVLLIAAVVAAMVPAVVADTVVRKDGRAVEGRVVSVDADWVVVEDDRGRSRVPRDDVLSITFRDTATPQLRIEIRTERADDSVEILFEDEVVAHGTRAGGSWTDLSARLKDGNNELPLRIRNDRGAWAYRILVRINGSVVAVECGRPGREDDPCTCCGRTGFETGVIEDLPPIWIAVDRDAGHAEVLD